MKLFPSFARSVFSHCLVFGIAAAFLFPGAAQANGHRGCDGSADCRVCTNCRYCAYCNSGGTCGVCRSVVPERAKLSRRSSTSVSRSVTTKAHTPTTGSDERKAVLDALRVPVGKTFHQKVIFKVTHLQVSQVSQVSQGWAFVLAQAEDAREKIIPSSKAPDGSIYGLLQKQNGHWQVLRWGAYSKPSLAASCKSDFPAAPRAIFP